jgi:hypothetical protein
MRARSTGEHPRGRPLLNARPLGDPERVDALILALAKAKSR